MRRASDNTISDLELMAATSGLLASGIKTSSDEIALAMEIAQLKAQQFGLTTTEAYSRMVTGARKFSVEMLDELGITIKAENAYKRRAEALGINVKALTDAQRAEALWYAILEDGRTELELHGGAVADYVTQIEAAEAAIANASLELKTALAPAVAAVAEEVPGVLNRLELLEAAIMGQISAETAWTAAAEAQRIEQEMGIEAARDYVKQIIGVAATVTKVSEALDALAKADAWVEAEKAAGSAVGVSMALEEQAVAADNLTSQSNLSVMFSQTRSSFGVGAEGFEEVADAAAGATDEVTTFPTLGNHDGPATGRRRAGVWPAHRNGNAVWSPDHARNPGRHRSRKRTDGQRLGAGLGNRLQ